MDPISHNIAEAVRYGRKRLSITRKQLASRADVSERYLNQLENRRANASVAVLARIAAALETTLTELIAGADATGNAGAVGGPRHDDLERLLATTTLAERKCLLPLIQTQLDGMRRASRGIALLGLRGAGKSTLGRQLAERHGLEFVSVTREIEARAGMALSDLFNLGGADAYRTLENEVVAELTRRPDRIVLETAGGIVGNPEALEMILEAFRTIWLKASPEEHLERVANQGDTRPMRGNPKALDHLKALLRDREPLYGRADDTLDTSGRTIAESLDALERISATPIPPPTA